MGGFGVVVSVSVGILFFSLTSRSNFLINVVPSIEEREEDENIFCISDNAPFPMRFFIGINGTSLIRYGKMENTKLIFKQLLLIFVIIQKSDEMLYEIFVVYPLAW